ncbi:MAG: YibE/F family protein [Clostridia bacterium]|nr:YibE/F family protein [Clostridia bacterium]
MSKKFFILLFCFAVLIGTIGAPLVSYATNQNEVYIKDYSEYEDLMNEFDDNAVNKEYYLEQLIKDLQDIEATSDVRLYEAEVIEIEEPELQYLQDTTTSEYAMGMYQYGKVRVTEKDSVLTGVELTYMACLTYDVYNNIVMPELKVGDTTYITLLQLDEETFVAISPELDTYVERFPTMLAISLIILAAVAIYFGKHSVKFLVPLVLMVDVLFFVMGPLVLQGFNLWLLMFFTILLNTIAIAVLKLGVNSKAFTAIFTTCVLSIAMIPVHFAIDSMLNFSGLTAENFLLSSGVLPNIIASEVVPLFNFHSLSVSITIIIMFALIALTSCKTLAKLEEHKAKIKSDELVRSDMSEYIAETSFIAIVIMLTQALPKYLILLAKRYTTKFVLQSEIFLIEFVRILIILIGMMLTVPLTLLINKFMEDN